MGATTVDVAVVRERDLVEGQTANLHRYGWKRGETTHDGAEPYDR